jgi:hypothetical protein
MVGTWGGKFTKRIIFNKNLIHLKSGFDMVKKFVDTESGIVNRVGEWFNLS